MSRLTLTQQNEYIAGEYTTILEKYYKDKYELECQDDKFKDSEENIFGDREKTKLEKFITEEAQLYRNGSLRYCERLGIVDNLSEEITNWLLSMEGRAVQGFGKAKVMVKSEKYYLRDMIIRLHLYSKILSLLVRLEEYEKESLQLGIELSADCEYEAYLLNKCILLSQVGYCKNECMILVNELNSRVGNNTSYTGDFYYMLAELNFSLQCYNEAQPFLNMAISTLENEIKNNRVLEDKRRYQIHDTLFAAHQLKALGFEFCGDFEMAIKYLTGRTPVEVVNMFKDTLAPQNFECLSYSSDLEGKYSEESKTKREAVIDLVEKMTNHRLFLSKMSEFVYDKTNQEILEKMVNYENQKIHNRIAKGIKDSTKIEKVYLANAISTADVNLIHEYIHILAHCINEYGVTFMKQCKEDEKGLAKDMILLGRALMLFVSEKRSIYKSCYATTYAEAGDTWIAKNELLKMITHKDYTNYDVATKAEIAFFYYLINSMSLIENDTFASAEEENLGLINRYFNYCYRNFDYDAIAHMHIYSFRNRIAELLQGSNLNKISKNFLEFAERKSNGKTAYQEFVDHVYFQNSNKRLRNEYEKVKYMYHFLLSFCQQYDANTEKSAKRNVFIFDYAFKYIHYYNATFSNVVGHQFDYIDFEAIETACNAVVSLLNGVKQYENIIESDHCKLIIIQKDEQSENFASSLAEYEKEANRKMFFVACKNIKMLQNQKNCYRKVNNSPKFRLFSSVGKGLKEFFIFTVFFMIKDDFFNPNNIFIMTPIGTAKACRYRVSNEFGIITKSYSRRSDEIIGIPKDAITQYRVVASEALKKETNWESQLNNVKYDREVLYIVCVTYDRYSTTEVVKYRYKYSVSDTWKEARLFFPMSWKEHMDTIYEDMKYNRDKIESHSSECIFPDNHCSVVLINSAKEDLYTLDDCAIFKQAIEFFSNISNIEFRKALIWRGENGSYVGWRIVFLTEDCPETHMLEIQQAMCCKGQGLIICSAKPPKKYQWPEPYDYHNSNDKFIFISHYTRGSSDNFIVKRELNDFFLKSNIPVWYDKEREIALDSWKDRIVSVLNHPNCAGIIILVTNPNFFESKSIQFELLVAQKRRKEQNSTFSVMPIIYGITSNNEQLREMIRTQIKDANTLHSIEDLILPTPDKVITYLQPNQSLNEYMQQEQKDGRKGSMYTALSELSINFSKVKEN